jgi:hypothetical protein
MPSALVCGGKQLCHTPNRSEMLVTLSCAL